MRPRTALFNVGGTLASRYCQRGLIAALRPLPLSGQRFETAEQILLARHASDLVPKLTVLKEQERWDRPDVVLEGKALILIDVDLGDFNGVGFFPCNLVEQRRDQLAGSAPFRPKIHQHWFLAVDFAVEVRFVEIDRR